MTCAACAGVRGRTLVYLDDDTLNWEPDNVRTLCQVCAKWFSQIVYARRTWDEALNMLRIRHEQAR